jgi:hypothetical protein
VKTTSQAVISRKIMKSLAAMTILIIWREMFAFDVSACDRT